MSQTPSDKPEYRHTMQRLENVRKTASDGSEFWLARDIQHILGYSTWEGFEGVMRRASAAFANNGKVLSHHIRETSKMMPIGKGGKRRGTDFFLSRGACYLITLNGDPTKPEIAAAQEYFASQTRARELDSDLVEGEKRVQMRDKVSKSFKVVSGIAKDAGVANQRQALFHDARYQGLYGMSAREMKAAKGIGGKEVAFDRMGSLELSANDFQMNLAAETIRKDSICGEAAVIQKNKAIAVRVRHTMEKSGSRTPDQLPAEEPIKEVRKRIKNSRKVASFPKAASPPS